MLEPERGRVAVRRIWGARRIKRIERHGLCAQPENLAPSLARQFQQRHLLGFDRRRRSLGGEPEHVDVEAREARQVRRHQMEPGD